MTTSKVSELPALTQDEREVAAFRARDLLWAVIGDLFDRRQEEEGLTFAALGRRIGRSRTQVQKWLSSPHNMTMQSAGLLAEGLCADLMVQVEPRVHVAIHGYNHCHPADAAKALVKVTLDPHLLTAIGHRQFASQTQQSLPSMPKVQFETAFTPSIAHD